MTELLIYLVAFVLLIPVYLVMQAGAKPIEEKMDKVYEDELNEAEKDG